MDRFLEGQRVVVVDQRSALGINIQEIYNGQTARVSAMYTSTHCVLVFDDPGIQQIHMHGSMIRNTAGCSGRGWDWRASGCEPCDEER